MANAFPHAAHSLAKFLTAFHRLAAPEVLSKMLATMAGTLAGARVVVFDTVTPMPPGVPPAVILARVGILTCALALLLLHLKRAGKGRRTCDQRENSHENYRQKK